MHLEERMPAESPADRLARALDSTATLVSGIRDDQGSNDTPCPEWDVQTLVNHLVSGNRMFAGIVRGEPSPARSELRRLQDSDQLGDDPMRAFREAAAELVAAFDGPDVLERVYEAPIGTVPGEVLFHLRLTEALVHGWDLAHATDQPAALPGDLAEEALAFSSGPTAPDVPRTGHPFGPIRAVADDAPAIDRLAAYLGRPIPHDGARAGGD